MSGRFSARPIHIPKNTIADVHMPYIILHRRVRVNHQRVEG
jgi:hypothetical protein